MEIQGLTPVDTLYEFAGYAIGHRLSEYLVWTWIFPTLIISAALLRLLYLAYRRDSFQDLAMYPLYVIFIAFLVWPIEMRLTAGIPQNGGGPGQEIFTDSPIGQRTETMKVPRILGVVHALTDTLVHFLISEMEPEFRNTAFAWQRVGLVNREARILDVDLRERFGNYVGQCYWPAVSTGAGAGWNNLPLLEDARTLDLYLERDLQVEDKRVGITIPLPCWKYRETLLSDLKEHLGGEYFHQQAVSAISTLAKQGGQSPSPSSVEGFYFRRVVYNELFGNEVSDVRRALPEYRWYKDEFHGTSEKEGLGFIASTLVAGISSLVEWWTQEALGPTTYYRVSSFAPYLYGLISSILLMGFPIAALWSFFPRAWTGIVNHLKLFLSVKIWPVFWAFLSRMNIDRGKFSPDDPGGFEGTFGQGEMFAALAGMYLLVPVLSYMLVSIVSHAGVVTMGALVGPGQTGGGPVGAAASHAARSAIPS